MRDGETTRPVDCPMAQTFITDRFTAKAIGYSIGFVILWAVLAAIQPSTTYHLAPLLVAVIVPVVYRMQGRSRSTGIWLALAGVGWAVTATSLLAVSGLLEGPSLLPFGGAFLESLVAAGAGGAVGLVAAVWPSEKT